MNHLSSQESFWNDNDTAQTLLKERSDLEKIVGEIERIETELVDILDLVELAMNRVMAHASASAGIVVPISAARSLSLRTFWTFSLSVETTMPSASSCSSDCRP